jgi:hypothetical protein
MKICLRAFAATPTGNMCVSSLRFIGIFIITAAHTFLHLLWIRLIIGAPFDVMLAVVIAWIIQELIYHVSRTSRAELHNQLCCCCERVRTDVRVATQKLDTYGSYGSTTSTYVDGMADDLVINLTNNQTDDRADTSINEPMDASVNGPAGEPVNGPTGDQSGGSRCAANVIRIGKY